MRVILYMILLLSIGGCTNQNVWVYESTGERQCEGGGVTLSESKLKLTNAGIELVDSKCGIKTGVAVIAVCGGPTVNIYAHKISAQDFERAKVLGFENINNLVSEERGTGYEFKQCPND